MRVWEKCLLFCCLSLFASPVLSAPAAKPAARPAPARRTVRIAAPTRNPPERPDLPVVAAPYVADGSETLQELEDAYRTSREWRKRVDVLKQLIEQYPDEPDWVYKLAATYSVMAWYDDAIDTYVRFATKWPNEPRYKDACIAISDDLHRSGRAEEDYKFLQTLPRDTPEWDIWVSVKMSERLNYTLRRDYDLSDRLCEDLIAKYPGDPLVFMAHERLADNYLNAREPSRRDYRKAQAEYEFLLSRWPDKPGAFFWHIRLSEAAAFRKDYQACISHLKVAIEKFPEDYPRDNWQAFNRFNLGGFYEAVGDRASAEREWLEVVKRYPKDTWANMASQKLGLPSVPEGASYTLRTAAFRLDAATGLTVRVSAPENAPMPEEFASAVFEVRDSKGLVDDPKLAVTVLDPEGRDWGARVEHASDGRYQITWTFGSAGTYHIGFRLTARGKTYGKDDLTKVAWQVGPPLMPVYTPVDLTDKQNILLLDVSTHASEWVQGAMRVPWSEIEEAAPTLPKDRLIAVYTSGYGYPLETAVQLKKLGLNVAAVQGGVKEFKNAGWPTEKEEP